MVVINMPSDQELKEILFGNSESQAAQPAVATEQAPQQQMQQPMQQTSQQPQSQGSQEELNSILFGNNDTATADSAETFDIGLNNQQERELPFADLAQLAFKSDSGKVGMLKTKYKFVEQNPETGKILAGNSPLEMTEYDPAGMDNGFLGVVANAISMVPEVAGQIGGAVGGMALAGGNPLGALPGGGAGSVLGTSAKQMIGNALPGGAYTAEEAAIDKISSGLFGAGGEGLSIALKGAGKHLIKPQLTRMLDAGLKGSAEPSKALKTIAKIFKFTASVDEKDVVDAGVYGFNKTLIPKYSDKKYVGNITRDVVEGVVEHDKALGNLVNQGDDWAKAKFGSQSVEMRDIGTNLLNKLSEKDIGFINPVNGSINVKAFASTSDFRAFKNIADEFFATNPKSGQLLPKNMKFEDLLLTRKRMDQFLKNYSNSENGNVYASNAMQEFVSGIRKKLAEKTLPKGINASDPKVMEQVLNRNPYLKANKLFSEWKKDLDLLQQNGLDVGDMSKLKSSITEGGVFNSRVESFVKKMQDKTFSSSGQFKKIVEQLPKRYNGGGINGTEGTIFDEIRKFNAAQGFASANPNFLRFGSIASYAGLFGLGLSDSKEGKIASLAGGLLAGTPAGASMILRGGENLMKNVPRSLARSAEKRLNFQSNRTATAMLSSLLRQQEKENSRQPKE